MKITTFLLVVVTCFCLVNLKNAKPMTVYCGNWNGHPVFIDEGSCIPYIKVDEDEDEEIKDALFYAAAKKRIGIRLVGREIIVRPKR